MDYKLSLHHIKSVAYTTIPGLAIALVVFGIAGAKYSDGKMDTKQVDGILSAIADNFNVTPIYALISLLPLAVVLIMAFKKLSALATMVTAAIIGMLIAIILQGYSIYDMMGFMNYDFVIGTASTYVSILIPSRMFIKGYDKVGIKRIVASRTCENSGICLDPLLPWTLGGVYYTGVLGVSPLEYAPWAVLCWAVPIIAIVYAITGLFVWKADGTEPPLEDQEPEGSDTIETLEDKDIDKIVK